MFQAKYMHIHYRARGGGGGGGRLKYEMPGCVCWGSENIPIIKETLCQKT